MKIKFRKRRFWLIGLLILGAHVNFLIVKIGLAYLFAAQSAESLKAFPNTVARLAVFCSLSALLTPLVLWAGYLLPLAKQHLPRILSAHFLCVAALGIIHAYLYGLALLPLHSDWAEKFRAEYFSLAAVLNNGLSPALYFAAVSAVQQAYFYFCESEERARGLRQAKLEILQTQLQPHFLFNALNAISTLVHKSPKDADQMIAQLSSLLRVSLKTEKTPEITLREELKFLQAYLQICRTLMKERLEVKWNIDSRALDALIPNMILQPLVENSIKHGLASLERGGRVEILARRRNGTLHLEMLDNGKGIDEAVSVEGVGLGNTRARLECLYGDAHKLNLASPPDGGLSVKIEIPYRN